MTIQVWLCELCQSKYITSEKAFECEKSHPTLKGMSIKNIHYGKLDGLYGMAKSMRQAIPNKVTIKFSDRDGHFASYKLDHVGYKGL